MLLVGCGKGSRAVSRCIWVKNPNIKICILSKFNDQNPLARMSRQASSVVMAAQCVMDSPLRGCSRGSVATLWHTSDSSEAVISRNSLCNSLKCQILASILVSLGACSLGLTAVLTSIGLPGGRHEEIPAQTAIDLQVSTILLSPPSGRQNCKLLTNNQLSARNLFMPTLYTVPIIG